MKRWPYKGQANNHKKKYCLAELLQFSSYVQAMTCRGLGLQQVSRNSSQKKRFRGDGPILPGFQDKSKWPARPNKIFEHEKLKKTLFLFQTLVFKNSLKTCLFKECDFLKFIVLSPDNFVPQSSPPPLIFKSLRENYNTLPNR